MRLSKGSNVSDDNDTRSGNETASATLCTVSSFAKSGSTNRVIVNVSDDLIHDQDSLLHEKRNKGIPAILAKENESISQRLLDFACESDTLWTNIFEKDGLKASKKNMPGTKRTIIRTDMVVPHHFKQILSISSDTQRVKEYKSNLLESYMVKVYNWQSFVFYQSIKPIPPFAPRDLCIFAQFRMYPDRNRIVYSFFTSPYLEQMYPPKPGCVRARIPIGGIVIEPMEGNRCMMQRFITLDMNGNCPAFISRMGESQGAYMPFEMLKALKKFQPNPPVRLTAESGRPITEDIVVEDVYHWIPDIAASQTPSGEFSIPQLKTPAQLPPSAAVRPKDIKEGKNLFTQNWRLGSGELMFLLNLTLVILSQYVSIVLMQYFALLLLVSVVVGVCLRVFITSQIQQYDVNRRSCTIGSRTRLCTVDLGSAIQYIRINKARRINRTNTFDISATHIVIKAVATVLSEMKQLNGRRIRIPLLGIDGFYVNDTIDISIGKSSRKAMDTTTSQNRNTLLTNVNNLTIEGIASAIASPTNEIREVNHNFVRRRNFPFGIKSLLDVIDVRKSSFASAVILEDGNLGGHDINTSVRPDSSIESNIIVNLSNIRTIEERQQNVLRYALPITISFNSFLYSVETCDKFAERVQKLVQSPGLL